MKSSLAQTIEKDPANWRGRDMMKLTDWRISLTDAHRDELKAAIEKARHSIVPLLDLQKSDFTFPTLGPFLAGLNTQLEGGRSFVVIEGLPALDYDEDAGKTALWGLGLHMGQPAKQDGDGNLLHSVKDTGLKVDGSDDVRSYQTNDHITFHNDGADVFLLFCLRDGKSGGLSRLVSSVAVFDELLKRRPDLAETLMRNYWFDTRGQRTDGARVEVMPVYHHHHGLLTANMKYRYIHTAQRFADVPRLTQNQRDALQMVQDIANEPDMVMEFTLNPGDILVANNYTTLHGRTAFQDWDEPDKRRHMLRLWLTIPNGRPLPQAFKGSRIYAEAYQRRMEH